jgi:hypothetical protein
MSWCNPFKKSNNEDIVIEASGDTLEQALQNSKRAANRRGLEPNGIESEFYCGICGWSPISTFPHSHQEV